MIVSNYLIAQMHTQLRMTNALLGAIMERDKRQREEARRLSLRLVKGYLALADKLSASGVPAIRGEHP